MSPLRCGLVALSMLAASPSVRAQPSSASGALGGGFINGEPAAVASAEVDLEGWGAALGLGMRLRFVDDELLAGDWDERSDIGRVLRYLQWSGEPTADSALAVAAGQLAGVELGNGSFLSGYAAGVDFDRGRAGLDARFRRGALTGHILIDDLLDPELFAARLAWPLAPSLTVGASGALDIDAGDERLGIGAVDARWHGSHGPLTAALTADGVAVVRRGVGAHVGAELSGTIAGARVRGRAELRAGTDQYIPGWVGPLYVRDRIQAGDDMTAPSQIERARAGGHAGLSWATTLGASRPRLGEAQLTVATRPGLPALASARVLSPSLHRFQIGAWAAVERSNGGAMAAELRVHLPRHLFASGEIARHYSHSAGSMDEYSPLWVAVVSLGARLGE